MAYRIAGSRLLGTAIVGTLLTFAVAAPANAYSSKTGKTIVVCGQYGCKTVAKKPHKRATRFVHTRRGYHARSKAHLRRSYQRHLRRKSLRRHNLRHRRSHKPYAHKLRKRQHYRRNRY